ncbi:metal-sulfur cluster assembly factor [Paucilactobacillus nenjiangensis]|jgi:metal-sulfur cluster biosynthetic enzyme|uniref:metal-sulfur cluster assembly factor n=1 Tax=Paucilactobacillus nenjiangensis TaxID=1296540 RepID=UPI0010F60A21|nr:metal-sulfur cluster assembly factor [Paucilactobacillus nenjiangensis]
MTQQDTLTNIESDVFEALKDVIDPELGIDIVNLGLIYQVKVADGACHVTMTLTTMGCPLGHMLDENVKKAATSVEGVDECVIDLVWEPAWDMSMMTRYAKVALGLHE